MSLHALSTDAPGEVVILSGNEAIARGGLEAGLGYAAAYPGSPSSEVLGSLAPLARDGGFYAEWSTNEKVAIEGAAAASFATGVGLVGLIAVDGYVNLSPFLYGGTVTPMALPTALVMGLFGAGVVAAAGPSAWPTRAFVGPSVRARLLRILIPFIPAMLLVEMASRQATGYFTSVNPALEHALLMLVFTAMGPGGRRCGQQGTRHRKNDKPI